MLARLCAGALFAILVLVPATKSASRRIVLGEYFTGTW
jgi:hypothetical protein